MPFSSGFKIKVSKKYKNCGLEMIFNKNYVLEFDVPIILMLLSIDSQCYLTRYI